jgi:hypothetical protein
LLRATNRAGILFLVIRREMGVKIVPVIKSGDLKRSVDFYTRVLDFERKWPGHEEREMSNGVVDLIRAGAELQLSRHAGTEFSVRSTGYLWTMLMSVTRPSASAG